MSTYGNGHSFWWEVGEYSGTKPRFWRPTGIAKGLMKRGISIVWLEHESETIASTNYHWS